MRNFIATSWFKIVTAVMLVWIAASISDVARNGISLNVDLCAKYTYVSIPGTAAVPSFCE